MRIAIANGIWLCAICSDLVDKDPVTYTADTLRAWKSAAEAHVLARLIDGASIVRPKHHAPSPRDKIDAARILDSAFDALAGSHIADRLNWRHVSRVALETARRAIRDAELLDPNSTMLPLLRAMCLLATGFPERALEILDNSATIIRPVEIALLRSRCLVDLGRLPDALTVLKSIVGIPGTPPALHHNIGLVHLMLGQLNEAEVALVEATKRDPTYGEAFQLLAQIAHRRGAFDRAADLSRTAYKLLPLDPNAGYEHVLCLLAADLLEDALRVLTSLATLFPDDPDILCLRARCAAEVGDVSVAEGLLHRTLASDPHHADALHNLGMVMLLSERFAEAQEFFERAQDAGYPEGEDIAGRIERVRDAIAASKAESAR